MLDWPGTNTGKNWPAVGWALVSCNVAPSPPVGRLLGESAIMSVWPGSCVASSPASCWAVPPGSIVVRASRLYAFNLRTGCCRERYRGTGGMLSAKVLSKKTAAPDAGCRRSWRAPVAHSRWAIPLQQRLARRADLWWRAGRVRNPSYPSNRARLQRPPCSRVSCLLLVKHGCRFPREFSIV